MMRKRGFCMQSMRSMLVACAVCAAVIAIPSSNVRAVAWQGAVDMSGGWKWTPWFGFLNDTHAPWHFHPEHGWFYSASQTDLDCWIWTTDLGWLWISRDVYPNIYRQQDGSWLFYERDTAPFRWFFNYASNEWECPDSDKDFDGYWQVQASEGFFKEGIIRFHQDGLNLLYEQRPDIGSVSRSEFLISYSGGYISGRLLGQVLYGSYLDASGAVPLSGTFTARRYAGPDYEIWGGNTAPPSQPLADICSFVVQNYTQLGTGSGEETFAGEYAYFFIMANMNIRLDAIRASTGDYWAEEMNMNYYTLSDENIDNI